MIILTLLTTTDTHKSELTFWAPDDTYSFMTHLILHSPVTQKSQLTQQHGILDTGPSQSKNHIEAALEIVQTAHKYSKYTYL